MQPRHAGRVAALERDERSLLGAFGCPCLLSRARTFEDKRGRGGVLDRVAHRFVDRDLLLVGAAGPCAREHLAELDRLLGIELLQLEWTSN